MRKDAFPRLVGGVIGFAVLMWIAWIWMAATGTGFSTRSYNGRGVSAREVKAARNRAIIASLGAAALYGATRITRK